jgi:hypothetical protein
MRLDWVRVFGLPDDFEEIFVGKEIESRELLPL